MKEEIEVINDKQFKYKGDVYTFIEDADGEFSKEGSDKKYALQRMEIFGEQFVIPLPVDEIEFINKLLNA